MPLALGLVAGRTDDPMDGAVEFLVDHFDQGVAEVDDGAVRPRFHVQPVLGVGVEDLQAAELVEEDGHAAEVGVLAQ